MCVCEDKELHDGLEDKDEDKVEAEEEEEEEHDDSDQKHTEKIAFCSTNGSGFDEMQCKASLS